QDANSSPLGGSAAAQPQAWGSMFASPGRPKTRTAPPRGAAQRRSRKRGGSMFVDSHCHLDFPELANDLPQVLDAMRENAVTHALCIGVEMDAWPAVHALATAHANLYASVGVHPDYADLEEPTAALLVARSHEPKVVAIGETGLDYYRQSGDLGWQRERFRTHIRAAREAGKPLVIHTRAAADDTIAIMREERATDAGGVMHCFTETWDVAARALELGFHISFSGIVTFRNAL